MKKILVLLLLLSCFIESRSQFTLVKTFTSGVDETSFTALNSSSFILGTTGSTYSIWVSDGTAAGTTLLKDLGYSGLVRYLKYGNFVYFNTTRYVSGVANYAFWKTDGTIAGTVLINNLNILNGGQAGDIGHPAQNWAINNSILYVDSNGKLWKFDTITETTSLLKDINPSGNLQMSFAYNINNIIYFRANHPSYGRELWKTDATTTGTVLVYNYDYDNNPATIENGDPLEMGLSNGTIFFEMSGGGYGYGLWKTDGTTVGTTLISPNTLGGYSYTSLRNFTPINSTQTIFLGSVYPNSYVIAKTDGTASGSSIVKYNNNSNSETYNSDIKLIPAGNICFFKRGGSTNGEEIWKTDGTTAGTVLIKDITYNSSLITAILGLTSLGNNAYFFKKNDIYNIHTSDGTNAGTVAIPLPTNVILFNTTKYFVWNGSLYFRSLNTSISANTLHKYTPPGPCPSNLVVSSSTPATYQSSDYITTSGTITYSTGNTLYRAAQSITITPSTGYWQASNGAVFEAKIAGCQ